MVGRDASLLRQHPEGITQRNVPEREQRGLAGLMRASTEIRNRLVGAGEGQDELYEVAVEVWAWSGDVFQFLDTVPAWELSKEWKAKVKGLDTSTPEEFAAEIGALTRENTLAYLDDARALAARFQRRLQGYP